MGTVEFAEEIATKYQALPDNYVLLSPRPNPFNAETSIVFETPERSEVALIVYDALGQAIRHLDGGVLDAGYHSVQWDGVDDGGRQVSTGVYIVVLQTPQESFAQKITLLK